MDRKDLLMVLVDELRNYIKMNIKRGETDFDDDLFVMKKHCKTQTKLGLALCFLQDHPETSRESLIEIFQLTDHNYDQVIKTFNDNKSQAEVESKLHTYMDAETPQELYFLLQKGNVEENEQRAIIRLKALADEKFWEAISEDHRKRWILTTQVVNLTDTLSSKSSIK